MVQTTAPTLFLPIADAGAPTPRPPLVLIADDQEWSSRAFESVLGPGGFAVIRAWSARHALEQARAVVPDLVLIRADLLDMTGVQLCRSLREETRVGAGTPIFLTAPAAMSRSHRLDALRAGAWDVLTLPVDAEELVLRMRVVARAKLDADRAREESLLDPATGLYSVHGLLRRVRELAGEAARHRTPLACVVFAAEDPADSPGAPGEPVATARMMKLVQHAARQSDVVGRLSRTEFAVLAPQTDPAGVLRMAQRLWNAAEELSDASPAEPRLRIRLGCYGIEAVGESAPDPVELLVRATMALRRAQSEEPGEPVCFY